MPPKSRFAFNMLLDKLFKRKEPVVIHMDLETDGIQLWGDRVHVPAEFINVEAPMYLEHLAAAAPVQRVFTINVGTMTPEEMNAMVERMRTEFNRVVPFRLREGYQEENGLVFYDVQEELNLRDAFSNNEIG